MTEQQQYVIYAIIDPRTDKIRYIGQTRCIKRRRNRHQGGNAHGKIGSWERDLVQAGYAPIFKIVEDGLTTDTVDDAERKWIAKNLEEGADLLNVLAGTTGYIGGNYPQEIRDKISATMKELWQDPEFHDEQVRKMTEALADPEIRAKMSAAATGRVLDEETRARISDTVTELWKDPDYREHQSRVHKQSSAEAWQDPETRKNHAAAMQSEETHTKISDASKCMWQDPETRSRLMADRRSRGPHSEEHKRKIAEGVKRNWLKRQGKQSMDQP